MPLVSIIVLNWNRPEDTIEVLNDLRRQTYDNIEMVLVDNASDDGSAEKIEHSMNDVKVIRSSENLGVPGGRNLGIENASGEILFFIDNDAFLEEDGIKKIVERFNDEARVGIISCRIDDYYSGELDHGSWVYPKAQLKEARRNFETYSFCGCGFAVRRAVFDSAGLLPACFFFCREEDEFSIRAIKLGYRLLYCGDVVVRHKTSPEGRYEGPERLTYCLRNLLITIWTHFPLRQSITMTLFRLLVYAEKGRRAGSWKVAPVGLKEAVQLMRAASIKRNPMDGETWKRYKDLNLNLQMHWWQIDRIRQEFGGK